MMEKVPFHEVTDYLEEIAVQLPISLIRYESSHIIDPDFIKKVSSIRSYYFLILF